VRALVPREILTIWRFHAWSIFVGSGCVRSPIGGDLSRQPHKRRQQCADAKRQHVTSLLSNNPLFNYKIKMDKIKRLCCMCKGIIFHWKSFEDGILSHAFSTVELQPTHLVVSIAIIMITRVLIILELFKHSLLAAHNNFLNRVAE
jgi:hypothetical protein